jgi:hypothetical protein
VTFPATQPTPWVTVSTGQRSNLFAPTDALTFTLSSAGVAARFDVIDVNGKLHAQGPLASSVFTIVPPLPYGGYRLRLYGASGLSCGATRFVVLCPAPHLPSNPPAGTPGVPYDDAFVGLDSVARAVLDVAPERWRYDPRFEASGRGLTMSQLAANVAHDMQWWGGVNDPVRPRSLICELPNGPYDRVPLSDTAGGVKGPQVYLASASVDPRTTWVSVDTTSNLIVWTGSSVPSLTKVETWPLTKPTADGELRILSTFSSQYVRAFCQYQGYQTPAVQGPLPLAEAPGVDLHSVITQMAAATYPAGLTRFEGPWNEPPSAGNGTMGSPWGGGAGAHNAGEQEACHAQALLTQAILAGAPSAKVVGPGTVTAGYPPNMALSQYLGGGKSSDSSMDTGIDIDLAWLEAEGRTDLFSEVTQHGYNDFDGDPWVAEHAWSLFKDILTNRGFGSRSRWMTEMGEFEAVYGVLHSRRQLSWGLRRLFIQEAVGGIPPERSCWFYDRSHGFWSFPSFWMTADGTPSALAAGRRAMSAACSGKTFAGQLPTSSHLRAYRYAGNAGDLVVLFTDGSPSWPVKVTLPSPGTVRDVFGNPTSLPSGSSTVLVSDLPGYILVPSGTPVTLTEPTRTPVAGGVDSTTGDATNIAQVQAGPTNPYLWSGGLGSFGSPWYDKSGTVPCSFTRTWTTPQAMSGLVFSGLPPWQGCSAPLGFHVDALVNGTWITQYTYTSATGTSQAFTDGPNGTGCTRESYWDEAWTFDCPFASGVQANAVRLVVTALSYGGEPDLPAYQAGGQGGTPALVVNTFTPYLDPGGPVPTPVVTTGSATLTDAQTATFALTPLDPSGVPETADPLASATFVPDSSGIVTVAASGLTCVATPVAGKVGTCTVACTGTTKSGVTKSYTASLTVGPTGTFSSLQVSITVE